MTPQWILWENVLHNYFDRVHKNPTSSSTSILLVVIWDGLPSVSFLYCTLCLLTHAPSLKKCSKDSRYQNVERKRGDADIPHLLWIVIVYSWDITIAIGHLIFHQLRQSKVKSILPRIPDKADIIENVDSTSSHLGSFPFNKLLILCPLRVDPKPSLQKIWKR